MRNLFLLKAEIDNALIDSNKEKIILLSQIYEDLKNNNIKKSKEENIKDSYFELENETKLDNNKDTEIMINKTKNKLNQILNNNNQYLSFIKYEILNE
jgi:hypothetical protein